MKLCSKCNNTESDSANFCSNCGSTELIPVHRIKNEFGDQINQSVSFENTDPQKELKTRKKKMLAFIGVLIILMLALLTFFFVKTSLDAKEANRREAEKRSIDYYTPYSPGKVENGVYKNKWADIEITMKSDWKEATKEQYRSVENDCTSCEFYAFTKDNSSISVLCVDLTKIPDVTNQTEDELLFPLLDKVTPDMKDKTVSEMDYEMIGNQLYRYVDTTGQVDGADTCFSSYLRIKDSYAYFISITGETPEKNHALVKTL